MSQFQTSMTWGGKVSLKQQKGEQEEDANLANTWAMDLHLS